MYFVICVCAFSIHQGYLFVKNFVLFFTFIERVSTLGVVGWSVEFVSTKSFFNKRPILCLLFRVGGVKRN